MEPSVWLIAGPTASGKSALALRLAQALGGEVINADSMQLYADLDVLTARPTTEITSQAPHHLYGVADAAQAWSVGRWLGAARAALGEIAGRHRAAIVVGGTGLYFRALTEGLAEIPSVPLAVRAAVEARFDADGEAAFRRTLQICDPAAAARIQPGDRQRLVRALSVAEATGRALSDWRAASPPTLPEGRYAAIVIDPPRAELYARCDARLDTMSKSGALEEARTLAARGLSPALPAMKALGVREFIAATQGRPLAAALAEAQLNTRHYAKRQLTWFRNQTPHWTRITPLDPQAQWRALEAELGSPQQA